MIYTGYAYQFSKRSDHGNTAKKRETEKLKERRRNMNNSLVQVGESSKTHKTVPSAIFAIRKQPYVECS